MIRVAEARDKEAWNNYIDHHSGGTFFHRYEWKEVIDAAIKHKTYYLIAEEDNRVCGVLPLTHVKSLLFGNNLVSNPFCVYGGIVADNSIIEEKILQFATQLAKDLSVDTLELRNLNSSPLLESLPAKDLYCTFIKPLSEDDEENLKAIPRKQRAMVRKAIKFGLQYQIDTNPDAFILAYETSVRNLGTPVFSHKYFNALINTFGDMCDILTVTHEGQVITSVLSFYYKGCVLPYYGGGMAQARALAGNDFMYWSLMEHAVAKGMSEFDFGRSKKGTGAYSFKKNWGFEPQPLHYHYYLNKVSEIPEVNPMNPKYKLFIEAWKRMPLFLARQIGPLFSRHLG